LADRSADRSAEHVVGHVVKPSTVEVLAGLGHFGPLEDPAAVGASVATALVRGADTPGA
jgi:hypothetical protein